jgi:hypothetical protein
MMRQQTAHGIASAHTLLTHAPSLPPSLHGRIDPATHKPYGAPLFLPPLTMQAMASWRSKVIRQLVHMNTLSGREVTSISGLKDRVAPIEIDALALTPIMSEKTSQLKERGLHEFLLEHNAAAANVHAQLAGRSQQAPVVIQRALSGSAPQTPAASATAVASALSILAAAAAPVSTVAHSSGPSPITPACALEERNEKTAAEEMTEDDTGEINRTGSGNHGLRAPHLSINLPTGATASVLPSPSPASVGDTDTGTGSSFPLSSTHASTTTAGTAKSAAQEQLQARIAAAMQLSSTLSRSSLRTSFPAWSSLHSPSSLTRPSRSTSAASASP